MPRAILHHLATACSRRGFLDVPQSKLGTIPLVILLEGRGSAMRTPTRLALVSHPIFLLFCVSMDFHAAPNVFLLHRKLTDKNRSILYHNRKKGDSKLRSAQSLRSEDNAYEWENITPIHTLLGVQGLIPREPGPVPVVGRFCPTYPLVSFRTSDSVSPRGEAGDGDIATPGKGVGRAFCISASALWMETSARPTASIAGKQSDTHPWERGVVLTDVATGTRGWLCHEGALRSGDQSRGRRAGRPRVLTLAVTL